MADLPSPTTPAYLSPPAAARTYNLSLKTVWRRIGDGTLPAYKVAGTRSVRIKTADLDALMIPINGGGAASATCRSRKSRSI